MGLVALGITGQVRGQMMPIPNDTEPKGPKVPNVPNVEVVRSEWVENGIPVGHVWRIENADPLLPLAWAETTAKFSAIHGRFTMWECPGSGRPPELHRI